MTPEQHVQRIRQIAFKLEKADYGLGMPRDYQTVLELRIALDRAIQEYADAIRQADDIGWAHVSAYRFWHACGATS
jgi:hypothetical protein